MILRGCGSQSFQWTDQTITYLKQTYIEVKKCFIILINIKNCIINMGLSLPWMFPVAVSLSHSKSILKTAVYVADRSPFAITWVQILRERNIHKSHSLLYTSYCVPSCLYNWYRELWVRQKCLIDLIYFHSELCPMKIWKKSGGSVRNLYHDCTKLLPLDSLNF